MTVAHLINSSTESRWLEKNLARPILKEEDTKDMGEGVYPLSKHLIVVSSLKDDVIYSKSQKLRVTQGAKMGCRPQTLRNCVCFISHPKHSTFQKGILRAGEGSATLQGIREVHAIFTLLLQRLFTFHE